MELQDTIENATMKPSLRAFPLADMFTLANSFCGSGAVFSTMRFLDRHETFDLFVSVALISAAFLFDVLDGRVARWLKSSSALGRELDSLADVISFGVAPASLAFACGMRGGWDLAVLCYFICCGVSRLARYNIIAEQLSSSEEKVRYFEGTPIPTSLILVAILGSAIWQGKINDMLWLGSVQIGPWQLHPLALMFALSGSLMISKSLRIPKL
jgi:CDP-diacylglycerol---serine O-phosphatidyltransferase